MTLNHENNRKTVASTPSVNAEMVGSFQHVTSLLKCIVSFALPKVSTFTRPRSLEVCIMTVLVKFVKC